MAKSDAKPHITRRQAENVRAAIKVGMIVDRLQKAAMGEIEMKNSELNAAKLLLDKTLPSLQAVEQTVKDDGPKSLEEINERIRSILQANPRLARELAEFSEH
ncbi:MAG: hypothetical protein OET44_07895 [Gammaproteobacteria bacterium]|nr:hypothetical protein [Gammaproteobacteria bacterium]